MLKGHHAMCASMHTLLTIKGYMPPKLLILVSSYMWKETKNPDFSWRPFPTIIPLLPGMGTS